MKTLNTKNYKYPDPRYIKIPQSFDTLIPKIPPEFTKISDQAKDAFNQISDENTAAIAAELGKSMSSAKDSGLAALGVFNDPKIKNIITAAIKASYQKNLAKQSNGSDESESYAEEEELSSETEEQLRNQVQELLRINADLKAKLNPKPKHYAPKMGTRKNKHTANKTNTDDEDSSDEPVESEIQDTEDAGLTKCKMPKIQKITPSTKVDEMLDYVLDAIIVTLHRPTIKLDDILDKIFEIVEAVLSDCEVTKGSLGVTTAAKIPMITTCLQTKIPTKYVSNMVISARKILSPQGFKKYKNKLLCLIAIPNLKSQYADLKKNLKQKLEDAYSKIKEEAFSYLESGVKFLAKSTVGPMIDAQKSQIISQIVRMSKKIFDELDPIIEQIIKAQKNKNPTEMLQTLFNQMKGGKRKTRKSGGRKLRKTQRHIHRKTRTRR